MQDFADIIVPSMYDATHKGDKPSKDYQAQNMDLLELYLSKFDAKENKDVGTTLKEVKKLISEGNGHAAAGLIIDAIMQVKKENEFKSFVNLLFPDSKDGYKFMKKAAQKIADDINAEIEKRPDPGYRVSADKVASPELFITCFQNYAAGKFAIVEQLAKEDTGEEDKKKSK